MKLEPIRDSIKNNKLVRIGFKCINYTEDGRALFGRVFGFLSEFIIILGGIKFLLGYDLNKLTILLMFLNSFMIFFFMGYAYRKLGLKAADIESATKLNTVAYQTWTAARIIINKWGKK